MIGFEKLIHSSDLTHFIENHGNKREQGSDNNEVT